MESARKSLGDKFRSVNLFNHITEPTKEQSEKAKALSERLKNITVTVDISEEARKQYRDSITAAQTLKEQERTALEESFEKSFPEQVSALINNADETADIWVFRDSNDYIFSAPLRWRNGLDYDGERAKSIEYLSADLLNDYAKVYDQIVRGYEDGTREVYFKDETAENGYRKLTMDEELDIINARYEQFAEGIEYTAANRVERLKRSIDHVKRKMWEPPSKHSIAEGQKPYSEQLSSLEKQYEAAQEEAKRLPQNIKERLMAAAKKFIEEYTLARQNNMETDIKGIIKSALFEK